MNIEKAEENLNKLYHYFGQRVSLTDCEHKLWEEIRIALEVQ